MARPKKVTENTEVVNSEVCCDKVEFARIDETGNIRDLIAQINEKIISKLNQ